MDIIFLDKSKLAFLIYSKKFQAKTIIVGFLSLLSFFDLI